MHHQLILAELKERREELRITQGHLAELAAVGLRTIKEIDAGKGNPTVSTLMKIADVLGMEVKLEIRKSR